MDKELREYSNLIGHKEYHRQYNQLFNQARNKKTRYSGNDYTISKERLNEIKEKYKNGVTRDILNEMLKIK